MPTPKDLQADAQGLATALDEFMRDRYGTTEDDKPKVGFLLLLHEFNVSPASVAYISNGDRADCIELLEEQLRRFRASS